jgi:hypothetical protein
MSTIAIASQFGKTGDSFGPQWIQVNIPEQLSEVDILLADDGFVSVLK